MAKAKRFTARKKIPNDKDAHLFSPEQNEAREQVYWELCYWSCFWCRDARIAHNIDEYTALHRCEYGPKAGRSKFIPSLLMETQHG